MFSSKLLIIAAMMMSAHAYAGGCMQALDANSQGQVEQAAGDGASGSKQTAMRYLSMTAYKSSVYEDALYPATCISYNISAKEMAKTSVLALHGKIPQIRDRVLLATWKIQNHKISANDPSVHVTKSDMAIYAAVSKAMTPEDQRHLQFVLARESAKKISVLNQEKNKLVDSKVLTKRDESARKIELMKQTTYAGCPECEYKGKQTEKNREADAKNDVKKID